MTDTSPPRMGTGVPLTPPSPPPRLDFVIHIIESLSPTDILDNRQEGRILLEALRLTGVEAHYYAVVNRETLKKSLDRVARQRSESATAQIPIIHISAHGNDNGIGLTAEKEIIRWKELGDLLVDVNKAVFGALLVCMSACQGFHGFRMAHRTTDLPFFALIGPRISPTWPDTFVAFQTFYHLVTFKRGELGASLRAMCVAAGLSPDAFEIVFGEDKQKEFQEIVKNVKAIMEEAAKPESA